MALKGLNGGKSAIGWQAGKGSVRPTAASPGNNRPFEEGLRGLYKAAGGVSPRNLHRLTPAQHGAAQAYVENLSRDTQNTIDYFKNMVVEASKQDQDVQIAAHNAEIKLAEHAVKVRESFMNKQEALQAFRGMEAAQDRRLRDVQQSTDGYVNEMQRMNAAIDRALAIA